MQTDAKPKPKPAGKKVEPLSPAEQKRRFEELSRELGADNGETLDEVLGKIVPPKSPIKMLTSSTKTAKKA